MVIRGVFIIISYYVLGNILAAFTGHVVPGSVIGMLLLFFSLAAGIIKAGWIRSVAEFLTGNMTVFFIPASIGIMDQWGVIRSNFVGWLGVVFISTMLVLVSTGLMQDSLIKAGNFIKRRRNHAE